MLVETAGRMIDEGGSERPMEDAIAAVLRAANPPFGFEDVTGLPWIEIDFPEDVERAERSSCLSSSTTAADTQSRLVLFRHLAI